MKRLITAAVVAAAAIGVVPTAHADPSPSPECANLQAFIAQTHALAAQHGDSTASFDAQMAPQIAKVTPRGFAQYTAGVDS
jgi:hypothetical protein